MNDRSLPEYFRPQDAANYLGISKTTLWRCSERLAGFPKKIVLSSRCVMYRRADLDAYMASQEV